MPHACTASLGQEVTKQVVSKVSATLSILGSSYIVKFVWTKWRTNRASLDPYQRIMAATCIVEVLFSFFVFFLGSWMTPVATGWWGAAGNGFTCSIQGFFHYFGSIGNGVSSRPSSGDF